MRAATPRLTLLALAVSAGLLLVPSAAGAATNFGSRLIQDPTNASCMLTGPCSIVSFIHPSDPDGDPYSGGAPVDGVITKFRIRAYASEPSQVTFRLADIAASGDKKSAEATPAGIGPTLTISASGEGETPIVEVGGRLPVKKGQHLAIDSGPAVVAVYDSSGSKFSYVFAPPLAEGGGPRGSSEPTGELLVAATIEPDADGDGFGDETQDRCPSQAATQGDCDLTGPAVKTLGVSRGTISFRLSEPATVRFTLAKKLPGRKVGRKCVRQTRKNRSHKRCARFKQIGAPFSRAADPGANQIDLPGGAKLTPGRYRLTMVATDTAGNSTTETTTFVVAKKKKKKKR